MGSVSLLPVDEWVDIDSVFLGEVMMQLGPESAEKLIADTLDALRAELATVARVTGALADAFAPGPGSGNANDHGNDHGNAAPILADLVAACDRLSRMAWEIGLTTLSGVAVDLALCAGRGNHTALRAVEARLQRVGKRSLGPAWSEAVFG